MTVKKTFYQVLDIPANASFQDILAAHGRQTHKLRSEAAGLAYDEFDYRQKLLDLARDTLSDPDSRRDYDAGLMSRAPRAPTEAAGTGNPRALARRAEALALHADAVALRADAMSLTTDASLLQADRPSPTLGDRLAGGLRSSLRVILLTIGAMALITMVSQSAFVFSAARRASSAANAASAAAKAEEQMVIEDYYQKHGVRPASAAEARLLERENQQRERAEREEEREKQREEAAARREQEEARRLGEQVSADLRYAEAQAARDEAREKARKEMEEARREAEEKERIRRQQQEWREIIRR